MRENYGGALRRQRRVAQGSNGQTSLRRSESRKAAGLRNRGTRNRNGPKSPTQTRQTLQGSDKGDSVTGSDIAHGNDSQLERISLNHTHPQTPAHTHAHTQDTVRMGPGTHEP